jgi:deoxyribonuclease-4
MASICYDRIRVAQKLTSHRIGAHESIAGSLDRSVERAVASGCNAMQIFSRSPRMWKPANLKGEEIERFRSARKEKDVWPVVIHGNYLINMASADPLIRELSTKAFRGEIESALAIGADYLVIHPGSHRGQTLKHGTRTLVASIAQAAKGIHWNGLQLLLENTAGGGMSIGRSFEELADLGAQIRNKACIPLGFCIDTAHCYQVGFDVSSTDGLERTLGILDRTIGLDCVPVLHCNDSKTALGSNHDRHANIGKGQLGRKSFSRFLHHPHLREKAFILETPADADGLHRSDMRVMRTLLRRGANGTGAEAPAGLAANRR